MLFLLSLSLLSGRAQAAGDPTIQWRTIETPHFLIHFDERNRVFAERLAVIAEETHQRLVPIFGLTISTPTNVVVDDTVDTANGSARTVPYNLIRVYAMAPEADSTLGDSDDWLRGLFLHEYIHLLHINVISGPFSIVNAVFGKTYAPNQILPRWYIEGLATYGESTFTEGGRLRNNAYRMVLRMAALEGEFLGLENLSGFNVGWPGATVWYLYGSDFVDDIVERHGLDAALEFNEAIGGSLSPIAVNTYAEQAFGMDMLGLWDVYSTAAHAEFIAESIGVMARGETAIVPITDEGSDHRYPRCRGPNDISFVRDDGYHATNIAVARLEDQSQILFEFESMLEVLGGASFDWSTDGRFVVVSQMTTTEQIYHFNDLFLFDAQTEAVERLTVGERAREPAISPDGRFVAYVAADNDGGADLRELTVSTGEINILFGSDEMELASMPDYSPDGRWLVFSLWRIGEARDIFQYDRQTGELIQLTTDRSQDLEPSYTPDGHSILFSSDRTGIFNAYELDLQTQEVSQLTNVHGGVFSPRRCAEDGPLFVRHYTSRGFDIGLVETLEPRPAPPPYTRPELDYESFHEEEPLIVERSYNPWPELYPRAWSPIVSQDGENYLLGAFVEGADPLGHHFWNASVQYGFDSEHLGWGIGYTYSQLPVNINLFVSEYETTANGRLLAESRYLPIEENTVSGGVNLFLPLSDDQSSHTLSASYTFRDTNLIEQPELHHDPADFQPYYPEFGRFDSISLGWSWGNQRGGRYTLTADDGTSFHTQLTLQSPIIGADFDAITLNWGFRQMIPSPLFDGHHVAILLNGGIGRASYHRRSLFGVGGVPEQDIIMALMDSFPIGSGHLRGYDWAVQVGTQYHLLSVEYRWPLWVLDTGPYTLPFFIRRFFLTGFFDYGTATDELDGLDTFLRGVGAEFCLQTTLGFALPADFRVGYAYGIDEGGDHHGYVLYGTTL